MQLTAVEGSELPVGKENLFGFLGIPVKRPNVPGYGEIYNRKCLLLLLTCHENSPFL